MQSFPSVLFPTQGLISIEETILVIASELNGKICMRVIWSLLLADSVLFQRLHLFGFFFCSVTKYFWLGWQLSADSH